MLLDDFLPFSLNLKLLSANYLSLDAFKICRLGKGLKKIYTQILLVRALTWKSLLTGFFGKMLSFELKICFSGHMHSSKGRQTGIIVRMIPFCLPWYLDCPPWYPDCPPWRATWVPGERMGSCLWDFIMGRGGFLCAM